MITQQSRSLDLLFSDEEYKKWLLKEKRWRCWEFPLFDYTGKGGDKGGKRKPSAMAAVDGTGFIILKSMGVSVHVIFVVEAGGQKTQKSKLKSILGFNIVFTQYT